MTTTTTPEPSTTPGSDPREAVLAASQRWIAAFNRGDAESCAGTYLEDAHMEAKPMGVFQGQAAILEFWRGLIADGARELAYSEVSLRVVDERCVELAAVWQMAHVYGRISLERWVLDASGRWRLADDRFEVLGERG